MENENKRITEATCEPSPDNKKIENISEILDDFKSNILTKTQTITAIQTTFFAYEFNQNIVLKVNSKKKYDISPTDNIQKTEMTLS